MPHSSQVDTDNGISWYVEQSGTGPHILLIPSGEGDCHSFGAIATLLSTDFTVTTFDMPGFSRSPAPASALRNLSPSVIANQIISLMDKLSISSAIIYGSSSGGLVALALLLNHDERVERIIIHEVPMECLPNIKNWAALPESEDVKTAAICKDIFANFMNEDKSAWEGLGAEFHSRLEKNFSTWYRNYIPVVEEAEWDKEVLKRKKGKIHWTVGALMPMGTFFDNVVFATEVGINITLLNSKHFPQVSIPGELAEFIQGC